MNDLFRRDPPRMSDEEDRRTWERVRTAATRSAPWWAALWARPAVRFGLPAVAVVLVAVVWIAVEQPASTHAPALQREVPAPTTTTEPGPVTDALPLGRAARSLTVQREHREPAHAKSDRTHDFAAPPAPAPAPPVVSRDRLVAGVDAGKAAGAPGAVKEEKAQASAKVTVVPEAARGEAANGLAPSSEAPTSGSTFGAMKQGVSAADKGALHVRGGRSDEVQYQYDGLAVADSVRSSDMRSASNLAAIARLLTHRPLQFTAPLPVRTQGGTGAPERVQIDVGADDAVAARLVAPGAATPEGAGGSRRAYDRYEDAGRAEQILLVAYAADRATARGSGSSLLPALVARARRLADEGGAEETAARALLARLEHTAGAPAAR